jgi:putative ABC transport system permease protein
MNIGPILRAMKHNRTRVTLLVLEIAMTLAIVTNCVNVILAERAKMNRPSGFDDDNILWARAIPFDPAFRNDQLVGTTIDADLRRLRAIPGVKAAANSYFQLWEGGGSSTLIKPIESSGPATPTQIYWSTADVFKALGVKITEGRDFVQSDHGVGTQVDRPRVVIISRTVANALFPDGKAIGKSIGHTHDDGSIDGDPQTVVGIFETFFNPWGFNPDTWRGVADRAMFVPARVGDYSYGFPYLIRCEPGTMPAVQAAVEKALIAQNANRVVQFMPTPEKKARWFSAARLTVFVMTGLIIVLVFVTALGILGITALSVSERTKQIGTRRALGATRMDILRHFLIENWVTTTAGLAIGVIGTYALNYLLVANVTDVKMPWQLVVLGMAVLWVNGLLATLPPALRATEVPPSIATRSV